MAASQSVPSRRALGARRWICIFLAVVLGGVGVILLAVAPTVAGDIAQAKVLAARGVRVPLVSATFTTQVERATRASGSDSCSLSGATVRFSLHGAFRTAKLREVTGDSLPTCADALAAAAQLDYAPGTPLLVDPQNLGSVALESEVTKQTASVGRADGIRTAGVVLLVAAAAFALLALIPGRRTRRPQQAGPTGPFPYGPPVPASFAYGPPERAAPFGPPAPLAPPYGAPDGPPPFGRPFMGSGTTDGRDGISRKHRTLGEQLNRNPKAMHASWLSGLAVLIAGVGVGGFSPGGLLLLVVVALPVVVAYRRDRLSFPIVFASLFLPAWPWAMYKAASAAR